MRTSPSAVRAALLPPGVRARGAKSPPTRSRKLMISQDTGSAIVVPARADLFFGAGDDAGRIAGRIKQMGRFAILVPREIDPAAAAAHLPLPRVKPKIQE